MRKLGIVVVIVGLLALWAAPAFAGDHLFNASHSEGVDNRGFANPVVGNPGDAQNIPSAVPGEGDPKVGADQGTPAVDGNLLPTSAVENSPVINI